MSWNQRTEVLDTADSLIFEASRSPASAAQQGTTHVEITDPIVNPTNPRSQILLIRALSTLEAGAISPAITIVHMGGTESRLPMAIAPSSSPAAIHQLTLYMIVGKLGAGRMITLVGRRMFVKG